jgi:hypothetical protein
MSGLARAREPVLGDMPVLASVPSRAAATAPAPAFGGPRTLPPHSPARPVAVRRTPAWRWALLLLPLGLAAAAVAWQWQARPARTSPVHVVAPENRLIATAPQMPRPAVAPPVVAPTTPPAGAAPSAAAATVREPVPPPDLDRLPPTSSGVPVTTVAQGEEVVPVHAAPVVDVPAAAAPRSPREACGARTNFSLFKCMQTQCDKPRFARHGQCNTLRETGEPG